MGVLGMGQANQALGQSTGPLAQFQQNVHQLHIIARYNTIAGGTRIQVNLIQTVTGVAVKSTGQATFWLIEPQHVDPEFFYQEDHPPRIPRGTPIQFLIFVDALNVSALAGGGSGNLVIVQRTENYALLKELSGRSLPELPIVTQVNVGESVVTALLTKTDLLGPGRFEEKPAQIVDVQEKLFFISPALDPNNSEDEIHGAPIFIQREGSWKLAGIFIDHGRSPQRDRSAVARLPELDQLIPKEAEKSDRDKDGIPDDQDRCPNIPGDPENQGCPSL